MLDSGNKLLVLHYHHAANAITPVLMDDIAQLRSEEIMGAGNSVNLACSSSRVPANEGCLAIYFDDVNQRLPSIRSLVPSMALACSVLYGNCLLFTLLPTSFLPSALQEAGNRTKTPFRVDPSSQQFLHDMKQQVSYSFCPLTACNGGALGFPGAAVVAARGVAGPILDICFLHTLSVEKRLREYSRPTLAVLQLSVRGLLTDLQTPGL